MQPGRTVFNFVHTHKTMHITALRLREQQPGSSSWKYDTLEPLLRPRCMANAFSRHEVTWTTLQALMPLPSVWEVPACAPNWCSSARWAFVLHIPFCLCTCFWMFRHRATSVQCCTLEETSVLSPTASTAEDRREDFRQEIDFRLFAT